MLEAIQNLRETFSDARSNGQEQCYGLHTDIYAGQWKRSWCDIRWRNHCTDEWGLLATIPASLMIETLTELLDELERLRSLRHIHKTRKVAA
jgi:hypothetical protein